MKRLLYPIIVGIILMILTSCSITDMHSGKGTILYIQMVENSFYGLLSDDGEQYEILFLETEYPEFMVDSLRVGYRIKELEDVVSLNQWGTVVEALSLVELEE
ncbi:hypothetical protein GF359_02455 [candidate division WOR-3 bacterium]|uniref:Uncharacterized protein n=1 Tax=candidate division WOR-3 bacterium TaxID=2052148 RepID=A0A9D5KA35_UNCW3|nr:hypothetical protein [candidate division WOR-3 bacterium]MBD3364056.1 hypothetical protein [candidate division WOR-3 bacterium]